MASGSVLWRKKLTWLPRQSQIAQSTDSQHGAECADHPMVGCLEHFDGNYTCV
jgi:hypothetical protein